MQTQARITMPPSLPHPRLDSWIEALLERTTSFFRMLCDDLGKDEANPLFKIGSAGGHTFVGFETRGLLPDRRKCDEVPDC